MGGLQAFDLTGSAKKRPHCSVVDEVYNVRRLEYAGDNLLGRDLFHEPRVLLKHLSREMKRCQVFANHKKLVESSQCKEPFYGGQVKDMRHLVSSSEFHLFQLRMTAIFVKCSFLGARLLGGNEGQQSWLGQKDVSSHW